jgi:hypothetical protein
MSRGGHLLSCILFASLVGVAGCGPAKPSSTPPPAGVLFQDDFANPTSGWDKHTGADVTTDYDNKQYLIAVEQPSVDVWAQPGLDLTDVAVQVQAQYSAGPVNNEYGLICRYQRGGDGKNSFYFFFISSDGYYALGKVSKDVRKILSPAQGSPQPTTAIKPQTDAVNEISATCQGSHLALTVNGTQVGEFTDTELKRGDIGLIAGTYDEGGVKIHFDNLVARQP